MLEHALGQIFGRIAIKYRNGALQDDRPVVVDIVGEMDGAATHFDAVLQGRLVNATPVEPPAAERWNQRRMNVHDPADKIVRDLDQMKESSQTDKIGIRLPASSEDLFAE